MFPFFTKILSHIELIYLSLQTRCVILLVVFTAYSIASCNWAFKPFMGSQN